MTGMYAISEMASLFDVSRQTLIYYDKIGLFKPAVVNEKGYRYYSPTQIPFMRLICLLRGLGLDLEEVEQLVKSFDMDTMTGHLREHIDELDQQIASLQRERADVLDRLEFYSDAAYWREREGVPTLQSFPERYVVFEPFPADAELGRSQLHPTLMRAIMRMRELVGMGPMRGWGTMLRRESFGLENPIEGAGSFAVIAGEVDEALRSKVEVLPAGTYLCISRWGMPYDPAGIRQALACMDEHRLRPLGNAYDFCYLDTTSYDEEHQEDFCCLQIPVGL